MLLSSFLDCALLPWFSVVFLLGQKYRKVTGHCPAINNLSSTRLFEHFFNMIDIIGIPFFYYFYKQKLL